MITEGNFFIARRVCVDLDKICARTSWGKAVDPANVKVVFGSCTVEALGLLKTLLSDTEDCLLPLNYV